MFTVLKVKKKKKKVKGKETLFSCTLLFHSNGSKEKIQDSRVEIETAFCQDLKYSSFLGHAVVILVTFSLC